MAESSLLGDKPKNSGPVKCLGLEFGNDAARRAYFTEELRKKLQDPEFRKIEGFPLGEDEAILALSDPPYYTACPNPWLADFIAEWESAKEPKPEGWHYKREPFAADVSEGKNDPIYNAHSYHTKVPHKAIMRYILHYTEPGDIVFDGFCGTGMTGVACQMCGDRDAVISLGYQVHEDGTIWAEENDEQGQPVLRQISRLGARRAVLNDLSPAATFIAYNYNTPVDVREFEAEARRILAEVEAECGWMYETWHTDAKTGEKTKARINYTVWSDVFVCPHCQGEVVFWDAAVDKQAGQVRETFPCPHCTRAMTKKSASRAWDTKIDKVLKKQIRQARQVPVLINYTVKVGGKDKRFEKKPDELDLQLLEQIEAADIPYWFPKDRLMEGKETRRNDPIGITHVHHFYTKRNLWLLSLLWEKCLPSYRFSLTNFLSRNLTMGNGFVINTHNPRGRINGPLTGTLYIPSNKVEQSALQLFEEKMLKQGWKTTGNPISLQSATSLSLTDNSIDYIFIDPPFGANINYSELNFIWESWLRVFTNNLQEAIENDVQQKGVSEYRALMTECFREAYRILKPGRWMTVEFSNARAVVWNSIQSALSAAGFIVANVSILDKQHGGIKAMTYSTAVKQDLVISAYKPNGGFEERFQAVAQKEAGVWEFVASHLGYLPVVQRQGAQLAAVRERDPRILFDQMVAYHVRHGYYVPISSQDFQAGLAAKFEERDGMYFLPDQAQEYDRAKAAAGEVKQASLFVSDEATAIQWLRQLLQVKPQKFSDINPQFMQQLNAWKITEVQFDLRDLLSQNFLVYEGQGPVPRQIRTWLAASDPALAELEGDAEIVKARAADLWYVPDPAEASDLEKLREKALLRDFNAYREAGRKLKVFRLEAVRAGFRKAWQDADYGLIVEIAHKLPRLALEEDPKLVMWYDQAQTRLEQNLK